MRYVSALSMALSMGLSSALSALLLGACGSGLSNADCSCPASVEGYAFAAGERCLCMPVGDATPDPEPSSIVEVTDDEEVDWDAINAALADGPVLVRVSGERSDDLRVARTDEGPHRLVLDGGGAAVVPGITTGYDDVAQHRVTVRGFEITGGRDKGVYWRAGDDVLIEGNVVHGVRGSPAINLEYANRTGLPSALFVVRNNHVYDQPGECIYIGGAEGEDVNAHERVVIERNLVHDCRNAFDSKHDGINVKDRIREVRVAENVVARTDWGIEVASPGDYVGNVVIDTDREGFQVVDSFQPFRGPMRFVGNRVFAAGDHGFQLITEAPADGIVIEDLYVADAREAGLQVGGASAPELVVRGLVVERSAVALDGWGDAARTEVEGCVSIDNDQGTDRMFEHVACTAGTPTSTVPGGPDGVFFSGD